MTQNKIGVFAKSALLAAGLSICQTALWAQDGGGSSTTTTTSSSSSHSVGLTDGSGNWYNSPWVWVVGAIVFIVLLIALLGGRSRTVSRTTTTDTLSGDRVTVERTDEV